MSQDPTARVAPQVLPHIHLVADFAYPHIQSAHQQFILDELQKAPRIADNVAFSWQFLDGPPDGTVLLVYHPPQQAGVWASDGYVWTQEQYLKHTYGPFTIEMYQSINGYNASFEPRTGPAVHCRQRYRLLTDSSNPSKQGNPSLWLVHYRRSERMEQASRIPLLQPEMQTINARTYLKNLGHLQEKKFMLADVQNWPAVTLPDMAHHLGTLTFVGGGQMANRMQMHLAQQQAYNRDHGPSPKRPRHGTNTSQRPAPVQQSAPHVDVDEEDIAESDRRDVFDILTQRDISVMRFKNHEEWMEELFSGYSTNDIKPVDLQFDRAGFMQPITNGFFHKPDRQPTPPHESWKNTSEHYANITAKPFEQGETKRFAQVVEKRIAENNAQIAEMKRIHEERLKKLSQGSILRDAAARIRGEQQHAQQNAKGNEDSTPSDESNSAATPSNSKIQSIEEIAKRVQEILGKQIVPRREVTLIQKGGLQQENTPLAKSTTNPTGDALASLFDDFLEPGNSAEISAKPSASPQLPTATESTVAAPQGNDWVMAQKPTEREIPKEPPQPSSSEPADLDNDLIDFGALPGDDEANGNGDGNVNADGGAFDDAMHFDTIDSVAGGTPTFDGAGDSGLAMPASDLAGQQANPFAETADAGQTAGGTDTPDAAMDLMNDSAFDDAYIEGEMRNDTATIQGIAADLPDPA